MPELKPTYVLIAGKDKDAIRVLYERYGKKLFGYAQRHWKPGEDAAWDLVYKTLYRVLETQAKYSFASEEKFSAFVFTIFINYLRNFYRDKKNLPVEITALDETLAEHPEEMEDNSPSAAMNLLVGELDQLEDWERILLLMRSQDVAYHEIAKYVGRPEEQLKVYYGRLKKKLAEKLQDKINSLKAAETAAGKNKQA